MARYQSTMGQMDGLVVIDKPPGLTSHDVVVQVRKTLRVRRVGHTGTLDPFATGVLVLLIGRATRLAQFLSNAEKEYDAVVRLGYATDTGDIDGTPLEETRQPVLVSESDIEPALQTFRGDITQVPPMYSAKKKEGRKFYELARQGIEVERPAISVCIHELEAIKRDGALLKNNDDGTADLRVRVRCSAGTYVRTLAEDLGKRLGTKAHLAELRRIRAGDFDQKDASTLEQLRQSVVDEAIGTILHPPTSALSRLPFVHLTADEQRRARRGMDVGVAEGAWPDGSWISLLDERDNLIAVACFDAKKSVLHPRVVLAEQNSD